MGHKEEAEVGLLKAYSFFIELKRNWMVNMSISLTKLEAMLKSPSTLWMAVKLCIG